MIRISNTSSLSDLDLDDLDSIVYCAAKEIAEECEKWDTALRQSQQIDTEMLIPGIIHNEFAILY